MTKEYNQTDQASSRRERGTRAYPPSWLDHLTDWVERFPGPSWPYYLGLGLVLILIEIMIRRRIETYPSGGFLYPIPSETFRCMPYRARTWLNNPQARSTVSEKLLVGPRMAVIPGVPMSIGLQELIRVELQSSEGKSRPR